MANKFPQMPDFFSGRQEVEVTRSPLQYSLFEKHSDTAIINMEEWEQERFQQKNFQQKEERVRKWIYHFESDTDGAKLISNYLKDTKLDKGYGSANDDVVDMCVYYETGNYSEPVCLIKMTRELYSVLTGAKEGENWKEIFIETIVTNEKKYGKKVDAVRVRAAMERSTSEFGQVGLLYQLGIYLLQELAELIRSMKIPEKSWNPLHPGYEAPTLIKVLNFIAKKWEGIKVRVERFRNRLKELAEWFEGVDIIGPFFAGLIESIGVILDAVMSIGDVIADIIRTSTHYLQLAYAFVAGAVNEVIEMIASIADLLALLLSLTDKNERLLLRRTIENILQEYRENPGKIIDQLKAGFEAFVKRYSSDNGEYSVAYHLGEDAVRLALFIESVVAAISLIKKLPKSFRKMNQYIDNAGKRIKSYVDDTKRMMKSKSERYLQKREFQKKWRKMVKHTGLSNRRLLELFALRQGHKNIRNISFIKAEVFFADGKYLKFEYLANNSKKNHLEGGVVLRKEVTNDLKLRSEEFRDGKARRAFDSENKSLIKLDEDLANVPSPVVRMNLYVESMLKPCARCSEQIILRAEKYNAKVFVQSTKIKSKIGFTKDVKTFKQLLKHLNK